MPSVLLHDGVEIAPAEIAGTRRARRRGLLGRDAVEGVLVLRPCRQIHTIGMRFPIDVACCAADGRVLHIAQLAPWRVSKPVLRAAFVVEAETGTLARWHVRPGSVLTVEERTDGHVARRTKPRP